MQDYNSEYLLDMYLEGSESDFSVKEQENDE